MASVQVAVAKPQAKPENMAKEEDACRDVQHLKECRQMHVQKTMLCLPV